MWPLGIAIGFVILGLIFTMRRKTASRQAQNAPATPEQTSHH